MECRECGSPKVENKDLMLCSSCNRLFRKAMDVKIKPRPQPKRIPVVSVKMAEAMAKYIPIKNEFLKGKMCSVYPQKKATTVHHKAGRVGYADSFGRDNNIPLLVDVRYFLPVSIDGHRKIEENPVWAKSMGYSVSRHEIRKNKKSNR